MSWIQQWQQEAEESAARVEAVRKEKEKRPKRRKGVGNLSSGDHWRNHLSKSHGVHPLQVDRFNRMAQAAGLTGVRWQKDGKCKIESKGQLRKLNKIRKCVNLDSYE